MDKLTQKQVALTVITSVFYWPVNFFFIQVSEETRAMCGK